MTYYVSSGTLNPTHSFTLVRRMPYFTNLATVTAYNIVELLHHLLLPNHTILAADKQKQSPTLKDRAHLTEFRTFAYGLAAKFEYF